jgi:hypothetical protein
MILRVVGVVLLLGVVCSVVDATAQLPRGAHPKGTCQTMSHNVDGGIDADVAVAVDV